MKMLPYAKVVAHHAGVGKALAAMRIGVPQLLHPAAQDQPDNAARLEKLGLARVLSHDQNADWDWLDSATLANACATIQARLQFSTDGSERIADLALN